MTSGAQVDVGARKTSTRVALAAAALALGGGAWWLTNPHAVSEYPGSAITLEVPVGRTAFIDAGVYVEDAGPLSPNVITLSSAAPRVIENSAGAQVNVVLCRHDGTGKDLVGTAFADATPCDEVTIAGATEVLPATAQLLVSITPLRPGTVRVEGVDLTYRDGLRRGTVHSGTSVATTTG